MEASEIVRRPDPRETVRAEVSEVVRDRDGRPHVWLRVRLTGWHFPGRALEPFLLVGDVVSRFVVLDPDGASASAYFDRAFPPAERVSFGYGRVVAWDFDVAVSPRVPRLDRARLPKDALDPFTAPG